MQLVLHAPFGSRINKAWGLALRKRFCRQFNFELQAAATEEALLLSLGPQHSFPLADVFRYLHPATARDVLVQAFLDAPVFQTRWRWNTTISLAVPRNRSGKKVPPQLQRMLADDLMAAVFPDAAACLENIPGDRQIPGSPARRARRCATASQEAMDFDGLTRVLERIHAGEIRCVSRDTPEPSPLSHEILNARPYAFLDDAPLEERRTQAVYARRAGEPGASASSARSMPPPSSACADEQRPDATRCRRAARCAADGRLPDGRRDRQRSTHRSAAVAAQTLARPVRAAAGGGATGVPDRGLGSRPNGCRSCSPSIPTRCCSRPSVPPASRTARAWSRDDAIVELLRGRLTLPGPTTAARARRRSRRLPSADADAALLALESEGVVLRGTLLRPATLPDAGAEVQWCDRALLARIHRYTLNRLRAEIEPVSPADFMRFSVRWQHARSERPARGHRRPARGRSRCSTASKRPAPAGNGRSCRRAWIDTIRRCSTSCA